MEKVQEVHNTLELLIDELKLSPYGLDVAIDSYDNQKLSWTIRMKEHFVPVTLEEINEKGKPKIACIKF